MAVEIVLSCMKDGQLTTIGEEDKVEDEEMFACEVCDGLVKASDTKCPHCGAIFEEEEEVVEQPEGASRPFTFWAPGPRGRGPPDLQNPDRLDHRRRTTKKVDLVGHRGAVVHLDQRKEGHPDQRKEDRPDRRKEDHQDRRKEDHQAEERRTSRTEERRTSRTIEGWTTKRRTSGTKERRTTKRRTIRTKKREDRPVPKEALRSD